MKSSNKPPRVKNKYRKEHIHQKKRKKKKKELFLKKNKFIIIILIIVTLITLGILWYIGQIPICGDNYCVPKECSSGCNDCEPSMCQDGMCQPQINENCENSQDCVCDIHQICSLNRMGIDNKGCYDITCGDNYCDSKKEDQNNCCIDCGCAKGYECDTEKNECKFLMPEIELSDPIILPYISASTLYSNRELIDDNGLKHPFMEITITNKGENIAKNIELYIKIASYTEETVANLKDLRNDQEMTYAWYPTPRENILNIKDDTSVSISVKVIYEDEYGEDYSVENTYNTEIVGRSTWGSYSSYSQYVTPLDKNIRQAVSAAGSFSTSNEDGIHEAAEAIWDLLGNLEISYISDPVKEYRQYPAEVLSTKKGDCDDLATLYVTLLESVGIPSALISVPNHMFAAYYAGDYIWPIETTVIGSSFDYAFEQGKEQYNDNKNDREIILIADEWDLKNIKVPGDVGVEEIELKYPKITAEVNQDADWECIEESWWGGCSIYELSITCQLIFSNSGSATGQKCVSLDIMKDGDLVKRENVCEKVDPGDIEKERVTYTEQSYDSYSFNYLCLLN